MLRFLGVGFGVEVGGSGLEVLSSRFELGFWGLKPGVWNLGFWALV